MCPPLLVVTCGSDRLVFRVEYWETIAEKIRTFLAPAALYEGTVKNSYYLDNGQQSKVTLGQTQPKYLSTTGIYRLARALLNLFVS
jgi:hypothetical protein